MTAYEHTELAQALLALRRSIQPQRLLCVVLFDPDGHKQLELRRAHDRRLLARVGYSSALVAALLADDVPIEYRAAVTLPALEVA